MKFIFSVSFVRTARFFSILGALVGLDQICKAIAVEMDLVSTIHNYGWVGGVFTNSANVIRLGVLFGYYCGLWVILVSFLNIILNLSRWTQLSILLFFAGINGNMADRLRLGYVIDFIPFSVGNTHAAFNTADVLLGAGLILAGMRIWRGQKLQDTERRVSVFVSHRLQLVLFFRISLVFLGFMAAITGLSVLLFTERFGEKLGQGLGAKVGQQVEMNPELLTSFISIIVAYGFLFEAILLSVLLSVTQRWLGPIISFIEFMKKDEVGSAFKVRKIDEFKELESIARKLSLTKTKL
jgi:lipoprotein signal peptidase